MLHCSWTERDTPMLDSSRDWTIRLNASLMSAIGLLGVCHLNFTLLLIFEWAIVHCRNMVPCVFSRELTQKSQYFHWLCLNTLSCCKYTINQVIISSDTLLGLIYGGLCRINHMLCRHRRVAGGTSDFYVVVATTIFMITWIDLQLIKICVS